MSGRSKEKRDNTELSLNILLEIELGTKTAEESGASKHLSARNTPKDRYLKQNKSSTETCSKQI